MPHNITMALLNTHHTITIIIIIISFFFFFNSACSNSVVSSTVFLFGDSIFDAGNNPFIRNCSVQANFPPYGRDFFRRPTGRFTNGRTVGDFIEGLGIELQMPYMEVEMLVRSGKMNSYPTNGINFASAGSGVLNQTNLLSGVIPLQLQLQQFETLVTQNKFDKKVIEQALYLFESGSNDIFFYLIRSDPKPSPDESIHMMLVEFEQVVTRIHQLGGRRLAVFGLGPVGCIPAKMNIPGAIAESCFPPINEMVVKYNLGLEALANEIPTKLQGAVGVYASTFNVVGSFLRLPQRYGFTNVSGACCGWGALRGLTQCGIGRYEVCENPDKYVFWDYFHPSQHAYKLIYKAFWDGNPSRIWPMNLRSLVNLTLPLN